MVQSGEARTLASRLNLIMHISDAPPDPYCASFHENIDEWSDLRIWVLSMCQQRTLIARLFKKYIDIYIYTDILFF